MANKDSDLIYEAYKNNLNEDLGLGPAVGRIMKLAGDLNNDMSGPAKVTVHISGLEDEEDDRISSFKKLQKAKEGLRIHDLESYSPKNEVKDKDKSREESLNNLLQSFEDGEKVYIQAGEPAESSCGGGCEDDCGCNDKEEKRQIYDGELDMARLELLKANEYAAKLFHHIGNHPESDYLEGWVASKITKAADYLSSVYHYLDYEDNFATREPCYSDEEIDSLVGQPTAKDTGFAGDEESCDEECDEGQSAANDEMMEYYYEKGLERGLAIFKDEEKAKKYALDFTKKMMERPGPHG